MGIHNMWYLEQLLKKSYKGIHSKAVLKNKNRILNLRNPQESKNKKTETKDREYAGYKK